MLPNLKMYHNSSMIFQALLLYKVVHNLNPTYISLIASMEEL